jgi:beta-N-acetylhexosaminidase
VVTDAMTMRAVKSFSMSSYLAARAGCDMILMPDDELHFISKVLKEIQRDQDFRNQITDSVRRIVRLKVCLGLINQPEKKEESGPQKGV